mgnify:CR=1 FL=1
MKISQGYVEQWNGEWVQEKLVTRINLKKWQPNYKENDDIRRIIWPKIALPNHVDVIESVVKQYFKYKKFEGVEHVLQDWQEVDEVHAYMVDNDICAVTFIKKYGADVEGSQFCWDYKQPKLALGHYSLMQELEWYKQKGFAHYYMCESTGPIDEYKTKYVGFEWYTGARWSNNTKRYIEQINTL